MAKTHSKSASLVFPHQLFLPNPAVESVEKVYLIEEQLFFREVSFHKQKLAFHRATMSAYRDELEGLGHKVEYVRSGDSIADVRALIPHLAEAGVEAIHICEVADNWLSRRINTAAESCGIEVVVHISPGFLNSADEIVTKLKSRKRYFQTDFYIAERKSRRIMVAADGEPHGGKWSFDQENRKRVPAGLPIPKVWVPGHNQYLESAISSVEVDFPDNPGDLGFFN